MADDHPILEGLLELVYPTRCVVCEHPGSLLCDEDRAQLAYIDYPSACPRCGAPFGQLLCTECMTREGLEQFAFEAAFCMLLYDQRSESLVRAYKDANERRLAALLAELLSQALPRDWRRWADYLSWIPADQLALRRRGFDHMSMIASYLSEYSGIPSIDLLQKLGRADQRQLSRAERRANAPQLFNIRDLSSTENLQDPAQRGPSQLNKLQQPRTSPQMPKHLLLIDDVFTTGATLDAAATVLLAAGVQSIRVATIARVW